MAAKPIKSLELHYIMIQFLIICVRQSRLRAVPYIFRNSKVRKLRDGAHENCLLRGNSKMGCLWFIYRAIINVNLPAGCRSDERVRDSEKKFYNITMAKYSDFNN